MRRSHVGVVLAWMCAILCLPSPAVAQSIDVGVFEVSASGGMSGGMEDLTGVDILSDETDPIDPGDIANISDTHWNVGGGIAAGLTENILARFDIVRTRLFSASVDLPTAGEFVDIDASLLEFTGGVEYIWDRAPIAPFVGIGGGLARVGVSLEVNVFGQGFDVGASDTGGTFNLGGGVRAALSDRLGLRPQIQFVHIGGDDFWRASFRVLLPVELVSSVRSPVV